MRAPASPAGPTLIRHARSPRRWCPRHCDAACARRWYVRCCPYATAAPAHPHCRGGDPSPVANLPCATAPKPHTEHRPWPPMSDAPACRAPRRHPDDCATVRLPDSYAPHCGSPMAIRDCAPPSLPALEAGEPLDTLLELQRRRPSLGNKFQHFVSSVPIFAFGCFNICLQFQLCVH